MSGVDVTRLDIDPIVGIPMSQIDEVVGTLHERAVEMERRLEEGGSGFAR